MASLYEINKQVEGLLESLYEEVHMGDIMISDERATKAAKELRDYCEGNGCLYCKFHEEKDGENFCKLKVEPRFYEVE